MKKKINKGEIPDDNKHAPRAAKKRKQNLKTSKSSANRSVDIDENKSTSPIQNKKVNKKAIKDNSKKQDQLLRANVKITKHKSIIALILGIVFVLAGVLTAGFTTAVILQKPQFLVSISTTAVIVLTPLISFISTSVVGLYPTAIVFLLIGIGIFSIRNYKPWSTVQLILFIVVIYTLHLLFNQASNNSFPQYLEMFFENRDMDTRIVSQQLIIYLIVEIVLLMVISPICSILNEKWQIHAIKSQLKKEKNIEAVQKDKELSAKIKLEDDARNSTIAKENINSIGDIDMPIPIDVPTLSFIDKSKVYDTNTVKDNLTPFSNVPDSTEPKIGNKRSFGNSFGKRKKSIGSASLGDSSNDTQFDNLHTVSLSTLERAKKSVEDRMKHENSGRTNKSRSNTLESATRNNVDPILPLSDAVRKFNEPTQDELNNVKVMANNLFGGASSDYKTVKKPLDDRSSYENIMASGHLVNATKKNQNSGASAIENGSSISPFMNEILDNINEPTLKNVNIDNESIQADNYYGNGIDSIGKEKGRMGSFGSKSGELSVTTKSFIDQLNTSIAMHPNNSIENEAPVKNKIEEINDNPIKGNATPVKQYTATTAPTEAEKDAMRNHSVQPIVSSQLAGNGNADYVEKKLEDNQVAVGSYNSTAKPIGGGVLVDEKEAIVEDVKDEPLDLESAIAGLGGSRVVESARARYNFPPLYLLKDYPEASNVIDEFTKQKAQRLIETLAEFKYNVTLRNIIKGPTVTMFEIVPDPGIRVNSITNLSDNIAMNLAAEKVRILAPIPGETAVGVEIPNPKRDIVGFKEILTRTTFDKMAIPMTMGKNLYGSCSTFDVATSPHMLIAGSTGSGKSVCINSLICSIIYTRTPKDVRLIMVDPKVVELTIYNGIPHLLTPVITETKRSLKALDFCIDEMERRNKMLSRMSVRNIKSYNEKIITNKVAMEKMPYIVVIIDEFASLMSTAGKDLDDRVARLTAMSRAVGIHLVFATQRPSVDVITGVIKNNLPTRIAFAVTSSQDSRTIISSTGAENLLGKGDLLLSENGKAVSRLQGVFLSDDEVEKIVDFAKSQGPTDYIDESYFESYDDDKDDSLDQSNGSSSNDGDDLWEAALKIVVERKSASASFLQRRLRIGYNRAARLVEEMEEKGIVGPPNGSKPRELLRYPDMVSNE